MEIVKEEGFNGSFQLEKILAPAEMGDKLGLYARVTVPPGAGVPFHVHTGDSESYFILSGKGDYDDNGTTRRVKAGDATWTPDGRGHALTNTGSTDLVFMALIVKS